MRPRVVITAAVLAQFAISLIQTGLPALTFALHEQRGFGPVQFGVVYAATGVGAALALIGAGRLCDVIGPRPVLVAGALIGGGGVIAAAFATSLVGMTLVLGIAGVGSASAPVAGVTAIIDAFPPDRRGLLLGVRQMSIPAGGVAAAALLPALNSLGGLRLAFIVPGIAQLVAGLAFAAVIGPPARAGATRPSFRAVFGPALGWLVVTGGLYVTALGGVVAFTVAAAHNAGLSRAEAAVVFAALNVGGAVSRLVWGFVSDRAGANRRVRTLSVIGLVGAAGAVIMPFALHAGVVVACTAATALAFGTLGFNGVVYTIAGELGSRSAGVAVGVAATAIFLIGSVVAPAYGLLIEHAGYGAMFLVVCGVCLAGSLTARRIAGARSAAASYTPSW